MASPQLGRACTFHKAWIGLCGKPADDSGYCEKHRGIKCCSCGEQATRECDQTGIQFVCGYPLCAGCNHGTPPKDNFGLFALGGGHHKQVVCDRMAIERIDGWAEVMQKTSPEKYAAAMALEWEAAS